LATNLTFNYLASDVGGGSIANYQFIRKLGTTITTTAANRHANQHERHDQQR